jgi:hypothetical protein
MVSMDFIFIICNHKDLGFKPIGDDIISRNLLEPSRRIPWLCTKQSWLRAIKATQPHHLMQAMVPLHSH